jgi:N-acetylmuramoyl-L-alanine amidase
MPLSKRSHLALVAAAGLMVAWGTFACASRAPTSDGAGTTGATTLNIPGRQLAQAPATVSLEPLPNKEFLQANGMLLIYPRAGGEINAPSTFFVGAAPPGSSLTLNGTPVRLNAQGYFAHTAPLKRGENQFTLVRDGQTDQAIKLKVKRSPTPGPTVALDPKSVQPSEDVGVTSGDMVPFAVRAAPGSAVAAVVGNRKIALTSAARGRVNLGLNTAFGVTYQAGAAKDPNFYVGFYRVQATDAWDHVQPKFVASKAGKTTQTVSPKSITVFLQPKVLQTAHDETIVRVGPGAGRTTPLPEGVRMLVDGYFGSQTRCELAPGKHVWIAREDLKEDSDPGHPPLSTVRTMNLGSDSLSARVVIPLDQRLPFQLEQSVNPNRLVLRLYGATADTDWVGPGPPAGSSLGSPGAAVPGGTATPAEGGLMPGSTQEEFALIRNVGWRQTADRIYQVTVDLKPKQQWGYWADYEGTNLVVHARKPPNIVAGGASLRNLIICVDPGHGGKESGAFGCSGVRESQVNLSISLKLKDLLEQAGATVVMTRVTDDVEVSLADRVNTAVAANANLLISVHNNSLPDGRDPWKERGTSTYYYQGQSLPLARSLKDGVVAKTGFPDFGCRWQNLALCRPSKVPACLVEVGFMIHPDEYAQLLQPSVQQRAANGIVSGVKKFLATSGPVPPAASTATAGEANSED